MKSLDFHLACFVRTKAGACGQHCVGTFHGSWLQASGIVSRPNARTVALNAERRLAFEMLELPGLAGRVGDQTRDAEFTAQIVDPPSQEARLDDDNARLFGLDQPTQLVSARVKGREAILAGCPIVNTGDRLVFVEIDGKNDVCGRGSRDRVHGASSSWGLWGLFAW